MAKSRVLAQSPGVMDGSGLTSAREWAQIAAAGARLANIGGDALEREAHAAKVGRVAERDVADKRKALDLENQYSENPEAFEKAWQGYSDGVLGSVEPELVNYSRTSLENFGNAAYGRILERRRSRDRAADGERVTALVQSSVDDLGSIAMRGELSTPTGVAATEKLKNVLAGAVTAGLMTQERADLRIKQSLSDASAESTLYAAKGVYDANRATGGDALGATRKFVDEKIINNPELALSPDERRAYAAKINATLGAEEATRKQDLSIARKAAQDAQAALTAGVRVSPETIDSLADQLEANGGQADAARLRAAATRADEVRAFGQQPLAAQNERVSSLTHSVAGNANAKSAMDYLAESDLGLTREQAAGIVGNLMQESRLNPGARNRGDGNDGSDSIGIAQWNGDRARALETYAQRTGGDAGDVKTQLGFIVEELKTSEGGVLAALKAAKTPEEAAAAFISFERPKGWTAENPRGGHGWDSRRRYAESAAGGGGADGDDLRLAKDLQGELGKEVDRQWTKAKADFDAGARPSPAALSDIITGATLAGDSDLLEEIAERVDRYDMQRELGQASLGDQQAAATTLDQAGSNGLLAPGRAAWVRDAAAVRDATISGLESDPVALVAQRFPDRFKVPAPLDISNSANLQAGLRQRAAMVQFGQQVYGTPALSVLGPGDMAAVQSVLDGPDPTAKLRVVADLTQALPPDVRMATWAKLGQKGPAAALSSFAGGMMSADPQVAQGILRGQTALVAEPRFAPREGSEGQAFNEALDAALPAATFGVEARAGEAGGYVVMRRAITARYADLSATVGDTSGKVDQNRMQRAVDDVTGGVLQHNGAPLIAPARGMSQAQFDALLFGITDADLAGVSTLSGTPITAEFLRGSAKLESRSDGTYRVRLNNDPARPSYAVQDSGHPAIPPGIFILDLRGRRPAAIPSWNSTPAGAPLSSWNFSSSPPGGLDTSWPRP